MKQRKNDEGSNVEECEDDEEDVDAVQSHLPLLPRALTLLHRARSFRLLCANDDQPTRRLPLPGMLRS